MRRPIDRDAATEAFDRRLLHVLSGAFRTAELHERNNLVAVETMDTLYGILRERTETLGSTTIAARNRHVFVDDERVRMQASDYLNLSFFLKLLEGWGVGSMTFLSGIDREELVSFVYDMARDRRDGDIERLATRLSNDRVTSIELDAPPLETKSETSEALPIRTYAACLDVLSELQTSIVSNNQLRTRRVRRVTQSLVDQLLRDEEVLITLTTIKRFDDHLFAHSTNVAVLAVAMGIRLGLSKAQLGELCLAAFLHDLGKVAVSRDILDKPGILNADERHEINLHPLHSVHILLNQGHLSRSTLRAIIGGFEHHLNFDMTGYPALTWKSGVTLFGRIITITDRFDAVTTPRVYRKTNFTPHQGVRHIVEHAGTQFDPALVQVFLRVVGLYPPGTVVGLDSGDVGLVINPPAAENPIDRPTVRIIRGGEIGVLVDLAAVGDGGAFPRSIAGVYNPGNDGLIPAVAPDLLALL